MDERDLAPVAVFAGPYTEAIVLHSLLEAEGIDVSLVDRQFGGLAEPSLFVRRSDADRAQQVVNDFVLKRAGITDK
jgi:hypothetical protein